MEASVEQIKDLLARMDQLLLRFDAKILQLKG
jgi:hypothetical protein